MMDTPTEKAAEIMNYYGAERQLPILCEECAELIQQACKCQRKGLTMHDDFIEELADVKIMIAQFESIMKLSERLALERAIAYKVKRQLERIRIEKERETHF